MFQFLLVSIMLFACIFVYADNPKINIQGRLTKDFGDPITGKKVKIQIGDLGSGTATENTDSEGLYNVNVSLTDLTFSADTDYTLYVYDSSNNKELAKTSIKFQHVPFSIYSSTATYAIKDSSGNIITDTYVVKNEDITGGTATKITYDSKGLVISSAALDTEDIPELASSKITSLTGYTIAPTAESIVNTDSLNKALGKLQKSIDTKQSATAGTGISLSGGSISLAENYGDTINPYGSKTAKYVLAAPSNKNGVPEFRELTADDLSLTGVSGVSVSGGSISLADNYGDTKNPYASKTKNYVLAAPNDDDGMPSFRKLTADDLSLTGVSGVSVSGGSISLAENYGDTINPYGSKTAKYVLAAPSNKNGVPEFRELTADDLSLTGASGVSVSGGSISLADNYGDTKNPYASKTKNYVLAAPNDDDGTPSFRKLTADDLSLTGASGVSVSGGSISLADNYGDTKNPYASKTKNYVLAAPNDDDGTPSFRKLTADDLSLTGVSGVSISGGSISLAENYGDTINPYGSKTAKYVLAAPSNENGVPEFRKLTADDLSLTGVSGVSVSGGSIYLLAASNTTSGSIGGIKGDGSTVNIDGSGVISVKKLPTNDSSYFATFSKENESNYVWVMNGSNQGWVKLGSDGQTVTGGADLAEMYASSENLQPGDVVSIDTTKNDAVVKTKVAEDTKVAGVVSTEPGLLLNKNQKGYKLALVGKVPTKVCNEGGNIKRGDLLVSASIAGYAKKAGANPKPGTIIGKALANFSSKKGTILVLVNLQ